MRQETNIIFKAALVVIAFMVLATATNPTVRMDQSHDKDLENLLEMEYLYPVAKNRSKPSQTRVQKYNNVMGVTRTTFQPFTAKPVDFAEFEDNLEDEFLIRVDHNRVKRQVEEGSGGGSDDEVTATLSLGENRGIAQTSSASTENLLQQEFVENEVGSTSTTVTASSRDGSITTNAITCSFSGGINRRGVAYVLLRIFRSGTFNGLTVAREPTIFNSVNHEVTVTCFLCPADRPCVNGQCGAPTTVSGTGLFPYGFSEADSRLPHSRWDISSARIEIQDGFPFFDTLETSMFIGDNGGVNFGTKYNPYYLRDITQANTKYVCIYCDDFDIRYGGDVFYHVYVAGDDNANYVLDRAANEVQRRTSFRGFRASWACVVTWSRVPEFVSFSATSSVVGRSTFQLVLITDESVGFMMYFFSETGASDNFRELAVHGFTDGTRFTQMEYSSRESEIVGAAFFQRFTKPHMHQVLGNSLNQAGVWMFKVGEYVAPSPVRLCYQWYLENLRQRSYFRSRAFFLGSRNCPCRRELLPWSAAFLPLPIFYGQNVYCVEMRAVVGLDTFECCYNRWGNFINSLPNAGSYNRFSRIRDPFRHALQDSGPKDWCCRQSNLCQLYRSVRPTSSCRWNTWRAILRFIFGDPHFMSLDGKIFTFNGLGEYRLIDLESENKTFTFKLQCRTAQAVNSTGEKVNATLFSAFAAEQSGSLGSAKIHVELNKDKTNLVIYCDDVDMTAQFYSEDNFTRTSDNLIVAKVNDTRVEFSFPKIGVVVTVTIISGTLSQSTVLEERHKGLTKGLLGNYNDVDTDDFISPDGTTYGADSTDKQLFPFGQSWAVTQQSDSILHYAPGQSITTFTDSSYTPMFEADISNADRQEATAVCGANNTQCIFDYAVTKNENLAKAATEQIQEAKSATQILANRNPTLTGAGEINVELGRNVSLRFVGEDADNDTLTYVVVGQPPTAFTLNPTDGTATWTPPNADPARIRIAANDSKEAQSPVLDVAIRLCKGCGGNGRCDFTTPVNRATSQDETYFQLVSCKCNTGYSGAACEFDTNGCAHPNPCGFGRTCSDVTASEEATTGIAFNCSACPDGYTSNDNAGQNSECKNIDECLTNNGTAPCPPNSKCEDTIGSYMCMCERGYRQDSSKLCIDIDECDENSNDCQQTCNNTDGGWTCGCVEGYTLNEDNKTCNGSGVGCSTLGCEHFCENGTCKCRQGYRLDLNGTSCIDIDECGNNLCSQVCNNTDGSYVCSCFKGFQLSQDKQTCLKCGFPRWGVECQSTCECQGRASSCDAARGCICAAGWTGPGCAVDVDECTTTPTICGEKLMCTNTNGSYTCSCPQDMKRMELTPVQCCCLLTTACLMCVIPDVNECISPTVSCPNNTKCKNVVGSYVCTCDLGYKNNNGQCVDINECDNGQAMCQHECRNMVGSYNCYCNTGYTLNDDRKTCTKDPEQADPCAGLTNLNCSHYCEVVGGNAECKCNRGYTLGVDRTTCEDINECNSATLNKCTGTCTNTFGGFNCSCPAGSKLDNDGRTCVACDDNHWGVNCVNECGCAPLGTQTCNKTTGCSCKSGFTGEKCQSDINECSSAACQANSDCINAPGSYHCDCHTGFEATVTGSCDDIDECMSTTVTVCDHICNNTVGSYQCSCNKGFLLEGTGTCKDIDECALGISGCPQKCRNTLGAFACECYEGYELTTNRLNCTLKPGATICNRTDCSADGGCRVQGGVDVCFCNTGYQLNADNNTCDDIDECAVNTTCSQNCTNTPAGTYTCSCSDGFQLASDRRTCEVCPDGKFGTSCAQNCLCDTANTISCNATDGNCTCRSGWMGATCTEDIPECTDTLNICGTNGMCNERNGSYSCACLSGFVRAADSCTPCTGRTYGINCANTCTCVFANTETCNTVNGSCTCNSGWNGTNCETNVNECSATRSVCTGANEVCRDTDGSYVCDCEVGLKKSTADQCVPCTSLTYGKNCEQSCTCVFGHTSSCNPVNGSCTCTSGWTGDNCETNVNECSATSSPCTGANEKCRDTSGSYVCDCKTGFGRASGSTTCTACTSPMYGQNCEQSCTCVLAHTSSCNPVNGSCTCNSGWTGDNCETNVNECSATSSPCTGANEKCRDTSGSYVCDCKTGFGRASGSTTCTATAEFITEITLNTSRYDSIIDSPGLPAYTKLQEDLVVGIDNILKTVSTTAHLTSSVGTLRKGSVVVPATLRVDSSKTNNQLGVLAAFLEKLAEVDSINVAGTANPVSKVVYKNMTIEGNHTVCHVYNMLKDHPMDTGCTVTNGIPSDIIVPGSDRTALIVGLTIPLSIILIILIIFIVYICCKRRRRTSSRESSDDRDPFRSAFSGNVPTKGNFGASRYMMYSPHTLSEVSSQGSSSSGRSPRRPKQHMTTPWVNERFQGLTAATRYGPHTEPIAEEPTSNFSWENLFSILEPQRNGQFEMPRPQVNITPKRPFRDSNA
ncbi:uncharacterized protein LOC124291639 [Haliotis rubra]|uniref:uncharacterized protein LOC124291639 n=1 Tax=Haliotis rubra TaxID=36100 RepID=UPI001EE60972|nr:uncharacterized protein LOC124291639 [Haliotis rubra]